MINILSFFGKTPTTPRERGLAFYDAMREYHENNCRQWYYNLAMLRGKQWAFMLEKSNELYEPAAPRHRIRATFNKLLPLFITKRNMVMPVDPIISTRPANKNSKTDQENSDLARQMLVATWTREDFQKKLKNIVGRQGYSIGYLETIWNDKMGAQVPTPDGQELFQGDVEFDAPSPFTVIIDYTEEEFSAVRRYLTVKPRSVDYIFQRWGKEVKPEAIDETCSFYLRAMALATNRQIDVKKLLNNHVMEFQYRELPTKDFPEGLHHVFTKTGDLIEPRTMDPHYRIENGRKVFFLPLDAAQDMDLPDMLISTNSVEQAIPAQCYFNQGKSTILENCKRLGRNKVLAPRGAIEKGAFTDDPDELIVEYGEGDVPGSIVPFKPPEMAQYHLDNINRMPAEMQDAFGVHDATQGILPRRATSGKLVSFLVGQDDKRSTDPLNAIDRLVENGFRKAMWLMANGYTEQRTKDLVGLDGVPGQIQLIGTQLRAIDVTLARDTALPKTAAERMDLATAVLEKQPTKEQVEIMFAIMQARTMEDLKAILSGNSQAEETYARMENFDMRKGIPRPVAAGENHQMHIKIHQEDMRNPSIPADKKMLNMQHIREHDVQAGLESAQRQQGQISGLQDGQAAEQGQPEQPEQQPAAPAEQGQPMQEPAGGQQMPPV